MADHRDPAAAGLFLCGDVAGRTRRTYDKKGGGVRYNITVTVQTPEGRVNAERWCDSPSPADIPRVGEYVALKVNLTHFRSPHGDGVRLTWGTDQPGESF
jgi:hypothetical protein